MKRHFLVVSFLVICLCILSQACICQGASKSSLPDYMDNLVFQKKEFAQPVQFCFPNEDSRADLQEIRTTHFGFEKVFYCAAYQGIDKQLLGYLLKHEFAQVESAKVSATYGPGNTHYFLFYTDKFTRLPNLTTNRNQRCLDLAKRIVKSIDYQNTYKGSPRGIEMQFHAITFSYVLDGNLPELPKIEKTYEGKAKVYKDPDDGKWKLDNLELQDRGNQEFMSQINAKYEKYDPKKANEGEAFLTVNAKKEGVKVTASGLQYKVLTEGTGRIPGANDEVTVNYRGTFVDGTEFDSSFRRGQPATFKTNQVIPGWTEAFQMMKTGSKWQIFVPSKLAYGEKGAGRVIPPNATLIFEVELISAK